MKFEFDHKTGMMRPKKDEEIYFAQSQGGGLIIDDNKNNIKYIIERDGRITKLFGSFNKNNLNLYDMRDARIIADRVMRLLGRGHKYADFHYFLRGYRMSESFIKACSDFLNESIWSDMQDRSAGDVVRKEDDINLLDETGLVNYMKKVYMPPSPNDDLQIIGGGVNSGTIIASLFKTNEGHYNIIYQKMSESNPEITFPVCPDSGIEDLLKEHYTVISIPRYDNKIYYIRPKDDSKITNKFFLEIIDFILDAIKDDDNIYQVIFKKKHINESIWSDMQDRSAGITQRKEDDINLLDRDGLYDYIYALYKQIEPFPLPLKSQTSPAHAYFSIPIFKSDYRVYRLHCHFDNSKISEITLMASDADVKDFKQALIDNFDATINSNGALTITAKDGTVSNQVCMDLIKTIVENAPEPYLKKREN